MKQKILVVDDNPDIVEIYKMRLQKAGYDVICSSSGPDAITRAKDETPDLIILDIVMPAMDGFQTGSLLKAGLDTKDIPIIVATARSSYPSILQAATEIGAVGYIVKPFDPASLLKEVEKALKKKEE